MRNATAVSERKKIGVVLIFRVKPLARDERGKYRADHPAGHPSECDERVAPIRIFVIP